MAKNTDFAHAERNAEARRAKLVATLTERIERAEQCASHSFQCRVCPTKGRAVDALGAEVRGLKRSLSVALQRNDTRKNDIAELNLVIRAGSQRNQDLKAANGELLKQVDEVYFIEVIVKLLLRALQLLVGCRVGVAVRASPLQ